MDKKIRSTQTLVLKLNKSILICTLLYFSWSLKYFEFGACKKWIDIFTFQIFGLKKKLWLIVYHVHRAWKTKCVSSPLMSFDDLGWWKALLVSHLFIFSITFRSGLPWDTSCTRELEATQSGISLRSLYKLIKAKYQDQIGDYLVNNVV